MAEGGVSIGKFFVVGCLFLRPHLNMPLKKGRLNVMQPRSPLTSW